jgi:hypothetical protein
MGRSMARTSDKALRPLMTEGLPYSFVAHSSQFPVERRGDRLVHQGASITHDKAIARLDGYIAFAILMALHPPEPEELRRWFEHTKDVAKDWSQEKAGFCHLGSQPRQPDRTDC